MRALPVFLAILSLSASGCGIIAANKISQMDASQIATLSDDQVCHPLATGNVVNIERQKRGLGDCDPAHLECKKLGYRAGTSEYIQCRQMFMQQAIAANAASQKAIADAGEAWQKAYNQPKPVHTSCQSNGFGGANCTSY